jgi:surfeit locus 1 family protein
MMKAERGVMAYRALALPFSMTLIGALVLIGLGKWQLDRREWKLSLVERIETRIRNEAIPLSEARDRWRKSQDIDYTRVRLAGRFLHQHERHLYTIVEGLAGWKVIVPLQTVSGDIVLVDRGFVPEPLKLPAARESGQIEGIAELTGLARASQPPNWFTPNNDPAANRWFSRDVPGLIASLPPDLAAKAAPFIVEAEAGPVPGDWPRAGVTMLKISNRHLEYALTWFALAATLLIVFVVYARSKLAEAGGGADANIAERGPRV